MNKDITGPIKEDLHYAIDRGRLWLEKHYRVGEFLLPDDFKWFLFQLIEDVFELAITTYALHVINSPEKDNAYNMLISRKRTSRAILRH